MLDELQEQDNSINNIDSEDELKEVVARKQKELTINGEDSDAGSEDEDSDYELKEIVKEAMKQKESVIDSEEDKNISNADSEDEPKESIINNEPKESIINNEPKESIIYDLLKKVGNVLEESTLNNNEELINNALKTINTLVTIISLKEQSKIANNFKELNKINNTNSIEKMDKTNTLRE